MTTAPVTRQEPARVEGPEVQSQIPTPAIVEAAKRLILWTAADLERKRQRQDVKAGA